MKASWLATWGMTASLAALGACVPQTRPSPVRPAAESELLAREAELLTRPALGLATASDAVVRVVGPRMACSGTLIADDLVLTAHHCVVVRGPAPRYAFTSEQVPAAHLRVELGGDLFPWADVGVKAVVAPPCGEGGGRGDLAVLVLDRKLVGVTSISRMVPRLDAPPSRNETVEPMGFGRCALSPGGIRRRTRSGGQVLQLASGTFEVEAAICPGDSGGPLLVRGVAGRPPEVVGVISLSAMDHDEATRGISVMARLDAFRAVFAYARQIADGLDASDLPPLSCD